MAIHLFFRLHVIFMLLFKGVNLLIIDLFHLVKLTMIRGRRFIRLESQFDFVIIIVLIHDFFRVFLQFLFLWLAMIRGPRFIRLKSQFKFIIIIYLPHVFFRVFLQSRILLLVYILILRIIF